MGSSGDHRPTEAERGGAEASWDIVDQDALLREGFYIRSAGFFMAGAGIWAFLCTLFHLWTAIIPPAFFLLVSAANLGLDRRNRLVHWRVSTQVAMTVMLPFAFQMKMGGLVSSGNVMIWSFLGVACALMFEKGRLVFWWMTGAMLLALIFLVFDPSFTDAGLRNIDVPERLFLAINMGSVSAAIMILARYFVRQQGRMRKALANAHSKLGTSYQHIKHHQNEMRKGMVYARNIQSCIMPDLKVYDTFLKEHFVFHRPKDEVGGDHYWAGHIDGALYVIVADCTGHGTPGGLLTMISYSLMNETVLMERMTDPAEIILSILRGMHKQLSRAGEISSDGLELAVARLDRSNGCIQYAGIGIDMIISHSNELTHLRSDRSMAFQMDQPIDHKPKVHELSYMQGAQLYFFTDGLPHQIGGTRGKKMKMTGLTELVSSIADLSMDEQRRRLHTMMENWQGSGEQLDDMLAIGLKVA